MEEVKITQLECKRCGKKWSPRKPDFQVCPGCNTKYWNIERKKKSNNIIISPS